MPLPPVQPGSSLTGDLAVAAVADVVEVFPAEIKNEETAPTRDTIAAALLGLLVAVQEMDSYAADQSNPDLATDQFEDGLAEDRTFARGGENESNSSLRARYSAPAKLATPDAIREATDAILAPYTDVGSVLFDAALDRWFVTTDPDTASWHSFPDTTPRYPERYYESEAALNGGDFLPRNDPDGAWIFDDSVGRLFVLLVPDLSPLNDPPAFMFNAADGGNVSGFYVGAGATGVAAAFPNDDTLTFADIFTAIVNQTNRIAGHSIRSMVIAAPLS
jgi:hypothetical protein